VSNVLDDFSMEMTGKDVAKVENAAGVIPAGTRINVTFLENEDLQIRLDAAAAVKRLGFVPVPHISSRRLKSKEMLVEYVSALQGIGASDNVLVVGGDPTEAMGPYEESLAVIESGVLEQHGVRHVSVGGHPSGDPNIPAEALIPALQRKSAALTRLNIPGAIITQVDFDVDQVLTWIAEVREAGVDLPVRVGVPGPASVKLLLGFASRLGLATSATIAKKYGLSVTNLLGKAGPENFIRDLQAGLDPGKHGVVKLHFYTFGGFKTTAEWIGAHHKDF
jgi:methylenetetrahydrofolate reductase (NADPH)